jgi:hypothetical protein
MLAYSACYPMASASHSATLRRSLHSARDGSMAMSLAALAAETSARRIDLRGGERARDQDGKRGERQRRGHRRLAHGEPAAVD